HLEEKKPEEIKQWMLDNGREADALRTYHIDITDFAKVWGLSGAKDLKGKLEDAIGLDSATGNAKIMNLCFKHKEANEKSIEFINVMSKVRVDHENGILTVRFTDDIMPFLINLASYTTIPLRATVGFKCNYSFGMLEHLLKRYTRGSEYPKHTLSLEALHATLGTDHVKSYKQWGNFKKFVLEPIERDFALV
ncbi:replication initiation protein, partial [Vibrio parahaemolyticus]|nr:replication initiation protein [Vibrio parahaemolyticus]